MHARGFVAMLVVAGVGGVAAGQDSVLYVTDGDSDFIKAIRGGAVIDQNLSTGGNRRYRIAVRETIWLGDMDQGFDNAEFDLDLDPTGATSPIGVDIFEGTDGATDGAFNYTVESFMTVGGVYRFRPDWTGGELLFSVQGTDIVGITFDSSSGNLWISDQNSIYEYDLAGSLISSFGHSGGRGSLAYEPATDTLWHVANGPGQIQQYSKTGSLLQTLSPSYGGNVWGAEFAMAAGCAADLDGDGDADVNDFFLYLDLFEAGDPRADITGDGAVDVNDFFAYLDLFEQGC